MTASFALPLRYPTHIGANITIEHVPCTGSSTSYGRVRPKVYDLLPQDGSIYLIMSVHERSFCERDSNPSCRDAGALHIPANVFLDARYHPQDKSLAIEVSVGDTYKYSYDPILVPWRRWAHRTTWMDVREFGGRSEGSVYGHRMAFSHGYRCPPSHLGYRAPSMGLVDFHCRRLRWRELFEVGPGVGVIPPSTFTSIWRELGYEIFCGKHYAAAQKSCMGNMFQVEEDVFTLYKVIVDNERSKCLYACGLSPSTDSQIFPK